MNRGGPLKRSGALTRKTPMRRGPRLRPSRLDNEGRPSSTKPIVVHVDGMTSLWQDVRLVIYVRAGARCELCGDHMNIANMEGHHRRSRQVREHRDCPCNALALCARCHHGERVHANYDGTARADGLILSKLSSQPAAEIPAKLRNGIVLLTCGGLYAEAG